MCGTLSGIMCYFFTLFERALVFCIIYFLIFLLFLLYYNHLVFLLYFPFWFFETIFEKRALVLWNFVLYFLCVEPALVLWNCVQIFCVWNALWYFRILWSIFPRVKRALVLRNFVLFFSCVEFPLLLLNFVLWGMPSGIVEFCGIFFRIWNTLRYCGI